MLIGTSEDSTLIPETDLHPENQIDLSILKRPGAGQTTSGDGATIDDSAAQNSAQSGPSIGQRIMALADGPSGPGAQEMGGTQPENSRYGFADYGLPGKPAEAAKAKVMQSTTGTEANTGLSAYLSQLGSAAGNSTGPLRAQDSFFRGTGESSDDSGSAREWNTTERDAGPPTPMSAVLPGDQGRDPKTAGQKTNTSGPQSKKDTPAGFPEVTDKARLPKDTALMRVSPPKLSAAVGEGQPNRPADVLLIQRLYNRMIEDGHMIYDNGSMPLPKKIPESGKYDQATKNAIRDYEQRYFYGMATPDGTLKPNSSLFTSMVEGVAQPELNQRRLSREMYGLARAAVPGGASGGKTGSDNITKHLPFIVSALKDQGLADPDMLLMALATIRAEASGFAPVSEGKSRFNTTPGSDHDFNVYDRKNGNQSAKDAYGYRGKGFVQLSGRDNYKKIGDQIGYPDLVNDPDKANDPQIAALVLAQFLKNQEKQIRAAIRNGDLTKARRLVNGGSNGLAEFSSAFNAGRRYLSTAGAGQGQGQGKAKGPGSVKPEP